MAAAAVPLALWVIFLRIRIGAWPQLNNDSLVNVVPLAGLVSATQQWTTIDAVGALLLILPTLWLLTVCRRTVYAPIIYAYAGFAVLVGSTVWAKGTVFGRLLLPLTALAIICGARELAQRTTAAADEDAGAAVVTETVG